MATELGQTLAEKIKTMLVAATGTFSIKDANFVRSFVPLVTLEDLSATEVRIVHRSKEQDRNATDLWLRTLTIDVVVIKKVGSENAESNAILDPLALFADELATFFEKQANGSFTLSSGEYCTFSDWKVVTPCDQEQLKTKHTFVSQYSLVFEVVS